MMSWRSRATTAGETMAPRKFKRLVLAISATLGIETLVWLTDVRVYRATKLCR